MLRWKWFSRPFAFNKLTNWFVQIFVHMIWSFAEYRWTWNDCSEATGKCKLNNRINSILTFCTAWAVACIRPFSFHLQITNYNRRLEYGPMHNVMAAQASIGGAVCESSTITFLVARRKVWLTSAAGVPCSDAANTIRYYTMEYINVRLKADE